MLLVTLITSCSSELESDRRVKKARVDEDEAKVKLIAKLGSLGPVSELKDNMDPSVFLDESKAQKADKLRGVHTPGRVRADQVLKAVAQMYYRPPPDPASSGAPTGGSDAWSRSAIVCVLMSSYLFAGPCCQP